MAVMPRRKVMRKIKDIRENKQRGGGRRRRGGGVYFGKSSHGFFFLMQESNKHSETVAYWLGLLMLLDIILFHADCSFFAWIFLIFLSC